MSLMISFIKKYELKITFVFLFFSFDSFRKDIDRRINEEDKKYVRKVLVRSFYSYNYDPESETISTNADPKIFDRICKRAYCEKLSAADGTLRVTDSESSDMFYLNCLLQVTGKTAYTVIKEELIPMIFDEI